jgi:hypothetical protein
MRSFDDFVTFGTILMGTFCFVLKQNTFQHFFIAFRIVSFEIDEVSVGGEGLCITINKRNVEILLTIQARGMNRGM